MIVFLLLNVLLLLLNTVFWLISFGGHDVAIASLPVIGEHVDSLLVTVVSYWNMFMQTVPYAELPWHIFLYFIIPFELVLLVGKIFLGGHLPIRDEVVQ